MGTLYPCEKANEPIEQQAVRIWLSFLCYDCITMAAKDEMDLLHPTVSTVSPCTCH